MKTKQIKPDKFPEQPKLEKKIKIEFDESADAALNLSPPQAVAIETVRLTPSPFLPQKHRRALFTDDYIEKLGFSISKNGLIHPIIVRAKFPDFEIVIGECRWLASQRQGIAQINCFIRDLSDAEALKLQYEENHRRQNNTAMGDALYFKVLMETHGCSEEQLADQLNTSRGNVIDKLKLNDLIPEAVAELESKSLPLKHAYYLAKFPTDTQREIVREKYAYKYNDRDEKAVSFDEFKAEVEANIVRRLADAPFDISDPRLHIKGLTCDGCPESTGFEKHLFPDLAAADSCLNSVCFRLKTDTHLKLKRMEIAAKLPNPEQMPADEFIKSVPLVTSRSYASEAAPFREKILTNQILRDAPECEFSRLSLVVEGADKGREKYGCGDKSCAIHNPQPPKNDAALEKAVAENERNVRAAVREKVLAAAMESFDDYSPVWMFDDLIQLLLLRLWHSCGFDTRKPILWIVRKWKPLPRDGNENQIKEYLASLDKTQQSKLIFLFIHATTGFYSNSSEEEIKRLAKDYTKLDYDRLSEEIREQMK